MSDAEVRELTLREALDAAIKRAEAAEARAESADRLAMKLRVALDDVEVQAGEMTTALNEILNTRPPKFPMGWLLQN